VGNPPAEGLLAQWGVTPSLPPKAHGRGGHSTNPDTSPPKSTVDPLAAIITLATPLIVTLLTKQINAISAPPAPSTPRRASKRTANVLDSPPSSPSPSTPPLPFHRAPSSPPPDVEHELIACMTSFGRSKALSDAAINVAIEGLSALGYTPDVLASTDTSNKRIEEVSHLPEGTVCALRGFARKWCGKVSAKRARMDDTEA